MPALGRCPTGRTPPKGTALWTPLTSRFSAGIMEQRNMNFRATPVSRCNGDKPKSAVSMAAYRSGDKLYDDRYQTTWDYTRKQSIYHSEIITPNNAPAWTKNRQQLWNHVEASEKRFDARVTREFTISLPQEMQHDHKVEMVRAYVEENFTKKGLIADVAYHNFTGRESHNPHCHIMITTRPLRGEKFGKKERELDRKDALKQWRKSYMDICNQHLEQKGYHLRITTESLKTRGITDQEPVHESMAVSQMRKKHEKNPRKYPMPEVAKENDVLKRLNQELADLKKELASEEKRERQAQARQDKQRQAPVLDPAEARVILSAQRITEQTVTPTNQNEPPAQDKLDDDTRELIRQWQEYRQRERRSQPRRDERGWEPER